MGLKILIDKWLLQQSLFRGKYTKMSTYIIINLVSWPYLNYFCCLIREWIIYWLLDSIHLILMLIMMSMLHLKYWLLSSDAWIISWLDLGEGIRKIRMKKIK